MKNKLNDVEKEKEQILIDCKKLLNEKDARINFLEENMDKTVKLLQDKENQLKQIENSISWKITKPLRNLRKKGEKDEN